MAVFPDRIVLKNSTDSQATIEAAIGSGGTDEITQGEIVIGLETNAARFYTIDGTGNVVTLGSAGTSLGDLVDVDLSTTPPTNGQVIVYNDITGNWEPEDQSSGSVTLEGLDDTNVGINGYYNGFETGDPAYTLGSGSTLSTAIVYEGTNSIVCSGNNRPRVKFDTAVVDQSKRYDFWAYTHYHDNAPGSSYGYVSLGGTWDGTNDGGYWLEWRTSSLDGIIYFPGSTDQALAETTANTNWFRDQWVNIAVMVDWGNNPTSPRTNTPDAVYVWVNNVPVLRDTSIGGTMVPQTEAFFQFQANDKTGSANTQYVDSVYWGQSDTWPFSTTAGTLLWESVVDYITSSPVDGQRLSYDAASDKWVNVNATTTLASLTDTSIPDSVDSNYADVSFLTKGTQIAPIKPAALTGTWDLINNNPLFVNSPSPVADSYLVSDTINQAYIRISYGTSDSSWDLGSGDFTVEGFMTITPGRANYIAQKNNSWMLQADGPSFGNTVFIRFYWWAGAVQKNLSAAIPQELTYSGIWHHFAATRDGSTLRVFVDGVLCGSQSITDTIDFTSDFQYAPGFTYDGAYGGTRITKGVARYTATFTPPTSWPETGQAVADGDVLTYDSANQKWEPAAPSGAGFIDDLADVDTSTTLPTCQ